MTTAASGSEREKVSSASRRICFSRVAIRVDNIPGLTSKYNVGTEIDYDLQMVELAAPIRMVSNNDRRWQEIGKQEDGEEGKMRRIDRAEPGRIVGPLCVCVCVGFPSDVCSQRWPHSRRLAPHGRRTESGKHGRESISHKIQHLGIQLLRLSTLRSDPPCVRPLFRASSCKLSNDETLRFSPPLFDEPRSMRAVYWVE